MSGLKGNRVNNLQDLTMLNKIANLNCVQKDIVKGWMGKSKGLLQIVWERGFVDLNGGVRIYCTLGFQNNQYGNTILGNSLLELICNCINFIKKDTLLQNQAHNMGNRLNRITVNRTTNCNPELAGW